MVDTWTWARWHTLIVVAAFVVTALCFVLAPVRVRLANSDDQVRQRLMETGGVGPHFVEEARTQGRFYFATPVYLIPWEIYRLPSGWTFSTVRALGFLSGVALLGLLCAQQTGNRALGALVALVTSAALHLPATFYPVLSYPPMAIGLVALLGGLLAQRAHARNHGFLAGLGSGMGLLIACLMCEMFVVFLPVFCTVAYGSGRDGRRRISAALPALTAATAYLAVYGLFALRFPSTYDGTHVSLDLAAAANALFRQTFGAVPGFELMALRSPPGTATGAFWRPASQLGELVRAVPGWAWLVVLVQATATAVLARAALRRSAASGWTLAVAAACVLLPNLPISLTPRYQVFAHHRMYPYVYSFYAYCAMMALAVLLWHRLFAPSAQPRSRRAGVAGLLLLSGAAYASAQTANHHTFGLLYRWYNDVAAPR